MVDVIMNQSTFCFADGTLHRKKLGGDVGAGRARFEHPDHMPQMTLGALEAREDSRMGCMQMVFGHLPIITP